MQYEPSAEELLAAIAELLEDELLPALPDALKHKCRVAANLARILEREARLGPDSLAREHDRLSSLLAGPSATVGDDTTGPTVDDRRGVGDAGALSATRGQDRPTTEAVADVARQLAERIRADDEPAFQHAVWEALVATAREDLAIAKPGHDAWEGT
jgi:hypothetical protein